MTAPAQHFQNHNGILHVEGIPLTRIAEEFGTPTYVYSANHIRSQYAILDNAMRKALPADKAPLICYACKANSNIAILKLIQHCGGGLEIVSHGELLRALKAGFTGDKIVSTGVGKSDTEIRALLHANVYQINIESLPELERINAIAQDMGVTANVAFRLNPDTQGGGHDKISTGKACDKFGLVKADAFEGFRRAADMPNINARGLHIHIGSQVFDIEHFKAAFKIFADIVTDFKDQGFAIDQLDIGGGFPIPYQDEALPDFDAYAQCVKDIILPLGTDIILEPGRFLVGNAGVLLSRTEYVKETEARDFIIVDAAMNDLVRPAMYEAHHEIAPVQPSQQVPRLFDIVGPVCETGDTFARQREIIPPKQGDLIAFLSAGAYGYCMASNYNTRLKPAEVLVDGERLALINAREVYEDLLSRDQIPSWL